jgi:farnesyl diphosphate synthase/geranylgeranyl diphosphate synthase type II
MTSIGTLTLPQLLAPCAQRAERALGEYLIEPGTPDELVDGLRYVIAGGKRLRPAMVYLSADAVGGGSGGLVDRAAAAVEMVHVYSLVHDDLPAMDDDDLRRGRATAHVQYGEPMAILIGDALLTRAFGVLGEGDDPLAGRLVGELAGGAGMAGMVAGQVADMDLCAIPDGIEGVRTIHRAKTGALIRAAARMGGLAGGADDDALAALSGYAEQIGLVFQVVDDILDETSTADKLGKTPGKDASTGKKTTVACLGLAASRQLADDLTASAIDALSPLGEPAEPLRTLARRLIERSH